LRIGIDYTSAARQGAGIGRYTRELVKALLAVDSSHRYSVFAAVGGLAEERWSTEVSSLRASRERNLEIHTVPLTDDWLARVWHRLRIPIPIELVSGPLDVFYSPDFTLPPTRKGTRTLLTIHDLSFIHHPDAFVPSLRRYLERVVPRSVERADVVLADSAHTSADLTAYFGISPERVRVITPGVDPRFRPARSATEGMRRASGLSKDLRSRYSIGEQAYILTVGTLQPRKNYIKLIQAFCLTRQAMNEDLQLLIAGGPGWLFEKIIAEAGKHESVHILGFVDDEDLPTLYRGASLFAFPSLYEGFGLPVLEAMACGVPVVCSNTSSLPEVAGDAALLVDPLDVEGLGAAMVRALDDEDLRQRMVERGLRQSARFTWEGSARDLLDVIDSWEVT